MTLKIYVWRKSGGSVLNYFAYAVGINKALDKFLDFQTSVGHAAIEIETYNPYSKKYISHRPDYTANAGKEKGIFTDLSRQPCLFDDITYGKELRRRQEGPYFVATLQELDETAILYAYKNGCHSGEFSYYHGLENNCCKVIYNLLKVGLGCPYNRKCEFCNHMNYGSAFDESLMGYSRKYLGKVEPVLPVAISLWKWKSRSLISPELILLNMSLSLVKAGNKKILEAWTPGQVINFVKKIKKTRINRCPEN